MKDKPEQFKHLIGYLQAVERFENTYLAGLIKSLTENLGCEITAAEPSKSLIKIYIKNSDDFSIDIGKVNLILKPFYLSVNKIDYKKTSVTISTEIDKPLLGKGITSNKEKLQTTKEKSFTERIEDLIDSYNSPISVAPSAGKVLLGRYNKNQRSRLTSSVSKGNLTGGRGRGGFGGGMK